MAFECKVKQVIELGEGGSAGNLVLCEVLLMRVSDDVLDSQGRIDPVKMDAVARMGQEYYCRVIPESIFAIPRPGEIPGVGFDLIPSWVRSDPAFTNQDLAQLAGASQLPSTGDVEGIERIGREEASTLALKYLREGDSLGAWKAILTVR